MVSAETTNSSICTAQGPIPSRPAATAARTRLLRPGPHGQVVVDDRRLPVQPEVGRPAVFERVEQRVEEPDEPHPPGLEGDVPLPVPVRVGDDPHPNDRGLGGIPREDRGQAQGDRVSDR